MTSALTLVSNFQPNHCCPDPDADLEPGYKSSSARNSGWARTSSRGGGECLSPRLIRRGREHGTAAAPVLAIGAGQEFLVDEIAAQRRIVGVQGTEEQADPAL
jgi:hypothetical protein